MELTKYCLSFAGLWAYLFDHIPPTESSPIAVAARQLARQTLVELGLGSIVEVMASGSPADALYLKGDIEQAQWTYAAENQLVSLLSTHLLHGNLKACLELANAYIEQGKDEGVPLEWIVAAPVNAESQAPCKTVRFSMVCSQKLT